MRVFSISSEAGTPDVPSPLTCPVGEHRAGDYDFADIVGVDGATASAQGADYAYAIVNLLDSQSGSAETIGGLLSELVALL